MSSSVVVRWTVGITPLLAWLPAQRTDSQDLETAQQLDLDVAVQAARREEWDDVRHRLYRKALHKFDTYLDGGGRATFLESVRASLAKTCIEYGEDLTIAFTLRRSPGRAHELQAEAVKVFRRGLKATLQSAAFLRAEERWQDLVRARFHRGILLRGLARADTGSCATLAAQADDVFEEFVWGGHAAMPCMLEFARTDEVRGDVMAAIDIYRDTIDAIWALGNDAGPDGTGQTRRSEAPELQRAYSQLADAASRHLGGADVLAIVDEFAHRMRKIGVQPDPVHRDSIVIARASVEARSGRRNVASAALNRARAISKRYSRHRVGHRARRLIRHVLRRRLELANGDLWFELAMSRYRAGAWEIASTAFKRALLFLQRESDPRRTRAAWIQLGLSHRHLQRHLEAALCFRRATRITPHATERSQELACRAIEAVLHDSFWDPAFEDLREWLIANSPTRPPSRYVHASRSMRQRDFHRALRVFANVRREHPKYELARVRRIDCLIRLGQLPAARAAITRFRAHLRANPTGGDEGSRAKRREALDLLQKLEARVRPPMPR